MMDALAQIALLIPTTIVSGLLGFYLGEFMFRPIVQARKFRADTQSLFIVHASVQLDKDPSTGEYNRNGHQFDTYMNASRELRRLASEMKAFCYIHPALARHYKNRRNIDFETASTHLLGFSTTLSEYGHSREQLGRAVRRALLLPEED